MSKEKKKAGRPSKFDQVDMEKVKKLAVQGWTDVQMADFFDVTEQTWNNWKNAHSVFFESLKSWKVQADERVERSLYERACGYSHKDTKFATHEGVITDEREYMKNYAPDTTACIFWLKNRKSAEWRDKTDVDLRTQYTEMSDEDLLVRVDELLSKRDD